MITKAQVQYTKQKMKIASTILPYWNKTEPEHTGIN
jgi:hypothetical protein